MPITRQIPSEISFVFSFLEEREIKRARCISKIVISNSALELFALEMHGTQMVMTDEWKSVFHSNKKKWNKFDTKSDNSNELHLNGIKICEWLLLKAYK